MIDRRSRPTPTPTPSHPLGGRSPMNRRHFLSASAAAATMSTATLSAQAAPASGAGRHKVLIPASTTREQQADLARVAPGVELVACANDAEAVANVEGASASYGFITAK